MLDMWAVSALTYMYSMPVMPPEQLYLYACMNVCARQCLISALVHKDLSALEVESSGTSLPKTDKPGDI